MGAAQHLQCTEDHVKWTVRWTSSGCRMLVDMNWATPHHLSTGRARVANCFCLPTVRCEIDLAERVRGGKGTKLVVAARHRSCGARPADEQSVRDGTLSRTQDDEEVATYRRSSRLVHDKPLCRSAGNPPRAFFQGHAAEHSCTAANCSEALARPRGFAGSSHTLRPRARASSAQMRYLRSYIAPVHCVSTYPLQNPAPPLSRVGEQGQGVSIESAGEGCSQRRADVALVLNT
jgi:hypothetical protein